MNDEGGTEKHERARDTMAFAGKKDLGCSPSGDS